MQVERSPPTQTVQSYLHKTGDANVRCVRRPRPNRARFAAGNRTRVLSQRFPYNGFRTAVPTENPFSARRGGVVSRRRDRRNTAPR